MAWTSGVSSTALTGLVSTQVFPVGESVRNLGAWASPEVSGLFLGAGELGGGDECCQSQAFLTWIKPPFLSLGSALRHSLTSTHKIFLG